MPPAANVRLPVSCSWDESSSISSGLSDGSDNLSSEEFNTSPTLNSLPTTPIGSRRNSTVVVSLARSRGVSSPLEATGRWDQSLRSYSAQPRGAISSSAVECLSSCLSSDNSRLETTCLISADPLPEGFSLLTLITRSSLTDSGSKHLQPETSQPVN